VPKEHDADLPALARPGAEPGRELWQYLRQNWLSNRVFDTYDDIIDAACDAWRKLIAHPKQSPPSACANGLTSVKDEGRW
jgi:hypothetical protein